MSNNTRVGCMMFHKKGNIFIKINDIGIIDFDENVPFFILKNILHLYLSLWHYCNSYLTIHF